MHPPSTPSHARSAVALTLVAALASTGCAGMIGPGPLAGTAGIAGTTGTLAAVDLDRPEMRQFPVANMTDLERDVRIETGGDNDKPKNLTPALFWSGIAFGTLGVVGSVGFGVAGYATRNQLSSGYEGDGLTGPERDDLVNRGKAFNGAAIGFIAGAVISYALALVTYGVDWNRCGPLVRKSKKRHCEIVETAD